MNGQQVDTKQVSEKTVLFNGGNAPPGTKHVDPAEENVDKAFRSVSGAIPVYGYSEVHLAPGSTQSR